MLSNRIRATVPSDDWIPFLYQGLWVLPEFPEPDPIPVVKDVAYKPLTAIDYGIIRTYGMIGEWYEIPTSVPDIPTFPISIEDIEYGIIRTLGMIGEWYEIPEHEREDTPYVPFPWEIEVVPTLTVHLRFEGANLSNEPWDSVSDSKIGTINGIGYNSGLANPLGGNFVGSSSVLAQQRSYTPTTPLPFKTISLWARQYPHGGMGLSLVNNAIVQQGTVQNPPNVWVGAIDTGLVAGAYNLIPYWRHYVFTEGSDKDHHYAWVNGVRSASEVLTNWDGEIYMFGNYPSSTFSMYYHDNVQIYDGVLSDDDIAILAAATDDTTIIE